jgi:LysM repeat protein
VKQGETMLEIADRYGIKVHKLYQKNGIIDGLQPAPGQRLTLKKKNKRTVRVLSKAHEREEDPEVFMEGEFLQEVSSPSSAKPSEGVGNIQSTTTSIRESEVTNHEPRTTNFEPASYIVVKGDTLYGIARRHGITVDTLVKLNNLADSNIHPGQKLTLEK